MLRNRLEDNRQEPLREFNRPVHLPHAAVGFDRFRRDDKYDRVGLRNQATEARLPILASRDVVAVEEWREATIFETSYQFVGKLGRIFARIRDEDLEFFARNRISHRLLDHIAVCSRARAADQDDYSPGSSDGPFQRANPR